MPMQPNNMLRCRLTQGFLRFIGKTGGEIFHEMMLRQGVKHICMFYCYREVGFGFCSFN